MVQATPKHGVVPGPDMLRHMIFESIRMNVVQFHKYANTVVIAYDGRKSWRKEVFKYYKHKRADEKAKLAPNVNWNEVYALITEICNDIEAHFPYVVVGLDRAEGDDVVGTLVKHRWEQDQFDGIIIISGDKDFKQIHYDDRIKQYSPVLKQYVVSQGAEHERRSIILTGDRLDGVPNVLSPDNSFADQIRQNKLMSSIRADLMLIESPEDIEDATIRRNYYRNMVLTDLRMTPKEIRQEIIRQYEHKRNNLAPTMKIFNYLVKKQLVELSQKTQDFLLCN